MLPVIPLLDTHVHFWDHGVDGLRWPWLEKGFRSDLHVWTTAEATERLGQLHAMERFTVPELVSESAGTGLAGVVHAHAATAAVDDADETRWLASLTGDRPWPNAIVGRCDLQDPGCPALLERHREASERCTSVRDMRGPVGLDLDLCERSLRAAADLDFAVELRTPPERFDMFAALADRHPDVTFVLSHAALPIERSPESLAAYTSAATMLAERPNWICKISALCGGSDPNWTVESIVPWAETAYGIFGPDRVMLGTNWPVDRLFGDYADVVAAYRQIFDGLPKDHQRDLFYRNAARTFRIDESELAVDPS